MGKDSEKGKYTSPEGSHTWEYLTVSFCAIGGFAIGCTQGWNSPTLDELLLPNSTIPITDEEASTIVAAMSVGQMVVPLLSILLVDRIGKQKTILGSTLPLTISWGMIMMADSVMVLTVARLMAGFAAGSAMSTAPLYMSEILSSSIRGSLTMICMLTFSLGMLFMFVAAPYLGVRLTAGFGMTMSALFMISLLFAPESPYFLVMVGRMEEAEAVLEKLRGRTDVSDEIEMIRATLDGKAMNLFGLGKGDNLFKQLFTVRGNLKALGLGMMLVSMPHLSGYSMLQSYCSIILEAMGSGLETYWATVIFILLQVFSGFLVVVITDRATRRTLVMTSGVLGCVLLLVIATYFFLMEHTDVEVKPYGMIPLCSTFLFVVAVNIGISSVAAIMVAEIFASDIKVLANCFIAVFANLVLTCISKSYLTVATTWGFGHSTPFFGFTIATFVCTLGVFFWLPETRGKTLLEIQRELND